MRRAALLLALLLPGCVAPAAETAADAEDAAPLGPRAALVTDACRAGCYEPVVAADAEGSVFVATNDFSAGRLHVSADGGRSFEALDPPPVPGVPTMVRGDPTVDVGPDGRLYWTLLTGYVVPGAYQLTGVQVAASADGGRSWGQNAHLAVATHGADRQWLAWGPEGELYLAFTRVLAGAWVPAPTPAPVFARLDAGVWVARSDDGGRSFGAFRQALPGAPGMSMGGRPLVTPGGALLVPAVAYAPDPRVVVATSDDGGATFRVVPVAEGGSIFPSLAQEDGGRLRLAWRDADGTLRHAWSDGGDAWTEGPRPPGRTTAAPWLATRGNATLLAWHEDLGERAALRLARLAGEAWEVVAHLPPHAGELHAANTDLAQFALDREGRALLTWADAEAGEAWLGWADVDGP